MAEAPVDDASKLPATPPSTPASKLPSTAELQAEVAAAQADLERSIAELRAGTTPQALGRRALDGVAGAFTDEHGGVRPDRVAIAVGAVVGFLALRALLRRI